MKKKMPKPESSEPQVPLKQRRARTQEDEDTPVVYKFTIRGRDASGVTDRRKFLKDASLGLLGLSAALSACEKESIIDLECQDNRCTCHVVCTCDTVSDTDSSWHNAVWSGTICTCNTVCTCDTVSTCSCDSQGGGGGPYWYPN